MQTHGTASVAYAGSLELWAATDLRPKFEAQTGYGFQGRAAGSGTLASEILADEINPGVFMSVGKKNIKRLWPTGRAKFVIQLATDPLVVAYNPSGSFAKQFNAIANHKAAFSSLFSLMSSPGIRIGRTDPNADPQGVYFILMMELAQSTLHLSFNPASTVLGVTKATPFGLPGSDGRRGLAHNRSPGWGVRRHECLLDPGDPVPPALHHPAKQLELLGRFGELPLRNCQHHPHRRNR